jgi:hypothetical protein
MTIVVELPGAAALELDHLLLDINGTLTCDGRLLDGVAEDAVKKRDDVAHRLRCETSTQHRAGEYLDVGGLTSATRREPMVGEMWTRCIDSQFWRYDLRAPWSSSRSRSALAASSTVRPRASSADTTAASSASCACRSARSAIARVRPWLESGARFGPSRRLRRWPSGVCQRP